MIFDIAGNFGSVVSPNLPVFPSLPAAATLVCLNNTAGTGYAVLQFNTTPKTATFSSSSSLGSPQSFTVTYFGPTATVDASEYEISATISSGPTTGSNWTLQTGGSNALLNTWYTLGSFPIGGYSFTCSGRRSGDLNVSVTIRHKIQTTYSSTRVYTLQQQSDAVAPSFFGITDLSISYLSPETGIMGVYFDNGSPANQFQSRGFRNGSYINANALGFSTGGISESEYEIYNIESSSNNAGMTFNIGAGTGNIGTKRGTASSSTSGTYWTINAVAGSYSGFIRVHIRHVTDLTKSNSVTLQFFKVT